MMCVSGQISMQPPQTPTHPPHGTGRPLLPCRSRPESWACPTSARWGGAIFQMHRLPRSATSCRLVALQPLTCQRHTRPQSTLFNALVENGKAQAANFPFCTIEVLGRPPGVAGAPAVGSARHAPDGGCSPNLQPPLTPAPLARSRTSVSFPSPTLASLSSPRFALDYRLGTRGACFIPPTAPR